LLRDATVELANRPAMNNRMASERLYESETTLRMVDSLVGELQLSESNALAYGGRLHALRSEPGDTVDLEIPPDFCVRAYWQVHELLECLHESRTALTSAIAEGTAAAEAESPLDRILEVVDRLDTTGGSGLDPKALQAELRRDLMEVARRSELQDQVREKMETATDLLRQAEAGLTRLGQLFEGGSNP
jgi:hypothetical protein